MSLNWVGHPAKSQAGYDGLQSLPVESKEAKIAKLEGFIDGMELALDHLELDAYDFISGLRNTARGELEKLKGEKA